MLILSWTVDEGAFSLHPHRHLFLTWDILPGVKQNLIVVFLCVPLVATDLSIFPYVCHLNSIVWEMLVLVLCTSPDWLLCCWVSGALCTFCVVMLYQLHGLQIFSPVLSGFPSRCPLQCGSFPAWRPLPLSSFSRSLCLSQCLANLHYVFI